MAKIYPDKSLKLASEPIAEKAKINNRTHIPDISITTKQTVYL